MSKRGASSSSAAKKKARPGASLLDNATKESVQKLLESTTLQAIFKEKKLIVLQETETIGNAMKLLADKHIRCACAICNEFSFCATLLTLLPALRQWPYRKRTWKRI